MRHFVYVILSFLLLMKACEAGCILVSASNFNIDPKIIYSIAKQESSLKSRSLNINDNKTYDIGIMQINSIHLPRLRQKGIEVNELFNECKNIIVGSWLLKESIVAAGGDVWKGVGYYHSRNAKYSLPYITRVKRIYKNLTIGDIAELKRR